MLVAALGLTILGFAFLVAAVATGQIGWAWACIAVGALGLILLVVDLVRGRGATDRSGQGPSEVAEEADHHPNIAIDYKRVSLSITTWASGGLTRRDFRLAGKIDGL